MTDTVASQAAYVVLTSPKDVVASQTAYVVLTSPKDVVASQTAYVALISVGTSSRRKQKMLGTC